MSNDGANDPQLPGAPEAVESSSGLEPMLPDAEIPEEAILRFEADIINRFNNPVRAAEARAGLRPFMSDSDSRIRMRAFRAAAMDDLANLADYVRQLLSEIRNGDSAAASDALLTMTRLFGWLQPEGDSPFVAPFHLDTFRAADHPEGAARAAITALVGLARADRHPFQSDAAKAAFAIFFAVGVPPDGISFVVESLAAPYVDHGVVVQLFATPQPWAESAVPNLIRLLDGEVVRHSDWNRGRIARALARIGRPVDAIVAALMRELQRDGGWSFMAAIIGLGELGPHAAAARDELKRVPARTADRKWLRNVATDAAAWAIDRIDGSTIPPPPHVLDYLTPPDDY